jgi:pimeloyl-ACP methyl ester carboxylesterase
VFGVPWVEDLGHAVPDGGVRCCLGIRALVEWPTMSATPPGGARTGASENRSPVLSSSPAAGSAHPLRGAPDLTVEERRVRSFDGTDIAYHMVGEGPPILLANGLGGSWKAWTHQLRHFSDRYRFVSWDQRGLYRSAPPPDRGALDVPAQARDGLAVLDAEGIEKTAVWGWSMGVQVALEMWRRAPDRISSIVLINGVAGKPWETLANVPHVGRLAPSILTTLRRMPLLVGAVTRHAVGWKGTPTWAMRLGLASRTLDVAIFQELAASFAGLDMGLYVHTLQQIGEHDAHDVLPSVGVPLLMMAGGRDLMTPRSAAERIVQEVPGAELLVVPGGTHYLAVEYPELVNLRIERFLRDRGWPPAASSGGSP